MTSHHGAPQCIVDMYRSHGTEETAHVEGRFCRMFETEALPPHTGAVHQLLALGEAGGSMDEGVATNAAGDSNVPAGYTYLGQLIDHDITLDTVSRLDHPFDPTLIENARTPNIDLDCVYGLGRDGTPQLYDATGHLVTGTALDEMNAPFDDLPRLAANDRAVIGDPRNDENIFVSQLQLAYLKFHNTVLDTIGAGDDAFEKARATVIHYHHRLIVEDFLPRIIDPNLLDKIRNNGRRYYPIERRHFMGSRPCMPVEFSVAAYRYGHSQVRARYTVNTSHVDIELFVLGGFKSPAEPVEWKFLFQVPGESPPLFARKIDMLLPGIVMNLPANIATNPSSLAQRNLLRGRIFRLPSGQTVARQMLDDGLIEDSEVLLPDTSVTDLGMNESPLWHYILQEAREMNDGNGLGPVGGRIVGEVLTGLIDHYRDRTGRGLDYRPDITVPQADPLVFRVPDMLAFAGSGV